MCVCVFFFQIRNFQRMFTTGIGRHPWLIEARKAEWLKFSLQDLVVLCYDIDPWGARMTTWTKKDIAQQLTFLEMMGELKKKQLNVCAL